MIELLFLKVKTVRFLSFFSIVCLLFLIVYKGVSLYTGDFSQQAITNAYYVPGALPRTPHDEVHKRLQQRFYYLSRGHQAYAFIGEDGKTVLKFFNFLQLQLPIWLKALPEISPVAEYRAKRYRGQQHRLDRLFQGHRIAEESGIDCYGFLYQHLQKTDNYFSKPLQVIDAIGMPHEIPLDQVVFILQEKAVVAREMFANLLAAEDIEGVKGRIDQLYELYFAEYICGIADNDPNVVDNVGFVGSQAIRIDVGRLHKNLGEPLHSYLACKINKRFLRWIGKYFPSYEAEIEAYLAKKISSSA